MFKGHSDKSLENISKILYSFNYKYNNLLLFINLWLFYITLMGIYCEKHKFYN